jgi:hypothetical protein
LEKSGRAIHWREFAETSEEVILNYADSYPALIRKDNLFYVTGWWDEGAYQAVFEKLGLTQTRLPNGLRYKDFGSYRLFMNYGTQDETFTLDAEAFEIEAAAIRLFKRDEEGYTLESM